ncbi:hypothetical protein X798_00061 [Onchocerca flexuosa]|uniref:Uncharacterized protein n=2 Tax=Onchocerca flexuosa TaxID=387005 RepID=A0A183GXR4_9BILA|nr:hypothetical protein X798_00061 [Onchocerca flexuosa]VDO24251.1 unnamed protein product [Onchocerca flexuosa]
MAGQERGGETRYSGDIDSGERKRHEYIITSLTDSLYNGHRLRLMTATKPPHMDGIANDAGRVGDGSDACCHTSPSSPFTRRYYQWVGRWSRYESAVGNSLQMMMTEVSILSGAVGDF